MSPTPYTLPSLPYALDALEPVISARIMELHHGTHHAAYVNNANALSAALQALAPTDDPTPIVRALAFNVSGHRLHSLFWECMSPDGGGQPSAEFEAELDQYFGSVQALKSQMTTALEKLSGSGWVALVWEPTAKRLVVTQIHDHQHDQIVGAEPILVIDGWEHAYYLQYEAGKAKWAAAFWEIVNWDGVGRRLHNLALSTSLMTSV
jgi:superoxide dismutase, Fe-Mn family